MGYQYGGNWRLKAKYFLHSYSVLRCAFKISLCTIHECCLGMRLVEEEIKRVEMEYGIYVVWICGKNCVHKHKDQTEWAEPTKLSKSWPVGRENQRSWLKLGAFNASQLI